MRKLFTSAMLLCGTITFGQMTNMQGFKKLDDNSYVLTIKDPVEAIHKYNDILDKNGADTNKVYDITKNPVDFGFFKKDQNSDKLIVCFLLRKDGKYDLLFGEIEDENTYFFDIIDEKGEVVGLTYEKE